MSHHKSEGKLIVKVNRLAPGASVFEVEHHDISPEELKNIGQSLIAASEKLFKEGVVDGEQECMCDGCVAQRAKTKEQNKRNPNVN